FSGRGNEPKPSHWDGGPNVTFMISDEVGGGRLEGFHDALDLALRDWTSLHCRCDRLIFPLLRLPVHRVPATESGSRRTGVILLHTPHPVASATCLAVRRGECRGVDRRVLDCVARSRSRRPEPTSVPGARGARIRGVGWCRLDTNLAGTHPWIRVRPYPQGGHRRGGPGRRERALRDVLLASLGRRHLAGPRRRGGRSRRRLANLRPHGLLG